MAGTVAKLQPYNTGPKSDGFRVNSTSVARNMEETDILNQLSDSKFNRRAEIIEQLRNTARKNGGRLPFTDQSAIFKGFAMALADPDWEVRHQCVQLINELIPHMEEDIDRCMSIVLPRFVPNMGDSKITIRRAVIQTLHVYMKHTYSIQPILRAIVQYGLDNHQSHVKKEVIIALPMLFTPEFSNEDFFEIASSLAKKLIDTTGDKSIQQHALLSLGKIQNLVGNVVFDSYIQKLSPPLRKNYFKLTGKEQAFSVVGASGIGQRNNLSDFNPGNSVAFTSVDNYMGPQNGHDTQIHIPSSRDKFEYGVVPSHIMDKLRDQGNFRVRAQAVEELKHVLKGLDEQSVHVMTPYVHLFISFLKGLLDDSNFKITTVTLEIIGQLVNKQGPLIKPHLKSLISVLTKPMSDTKIVIRQLIMKIVMQLMQIFSPKDVLGVICENLSHRNSRVRQETLNIVIASLLTFPSYDFDLSDLCQKIAHTLVDPKRQVRQAALECFAAVASNLGAGKLQPLVAAVDAVELSMDGDGVMAAVQARLARRILPKLNTEGLVEYATPVPNSAGNRGGSVNLPPGADIEWILCASGGIGGSARSNRSDMELESVVSSAASSARSTPAPPINDTQGYGPTPRRYMSAGKGKNRLPWDDSDGSESKENGPAPTKFSTRNKHLSTNSPTTREESPESGNSYRQMYLKNKEKRSPAQTEMAAQPFSVYNPNREDDSHSSYSTPRNADYSTWPEETGKSNKRLLEPIADNESEDYVMPTKPALARGTSSRASTSKRKVPPIALWERGGRGSGGTQRDEPDSARDSILDGIIDDDGDEPVFSGSKSFKRDNQMYNSIRQIRHSATRKKVDKLFEKLDTNFSKKKTSAHRSPSPETPYADSGFSSNMSTLRSEQDEVDSGKIARSSQQLQPPKKGSMRLPPMEKGTPTKELLSKSSNKAMNTKSTVHIAEKTGCHHSSQMTVSSKGNKHCKPARKSKIAGPMRYSDVVRGYPSAALSQAGDPELICGQGGKQVQQLLQSTSSTRMPLPDTLNTAKYVGLSSTSKSTDDIERRPRKTRPQKMNSAPLNKHAVLPGIKPSEIKDQEKSDSNKGSSTLDNSACGVPAAVCTGKVNDTFCESSSTTRNHEAIRKTRPDKSAERCTSRSKTSSSSVNQSFTKTPVPVPPLGSRCGNATVRMLQIRTPERKSAEIKKEMSTPKNDKVRPTLNQIIPVCSDSPQILLKSPKIETENGKNKKEGIETASSTSSAGDFVEDRLKETLTDMEVASRELDILQGVEPLSCTAASSMSMLDEIQSMTDARSIEEIDSSIKSMIDKAMVTHDRTNDMTNIKKELSNIQVHIKELKELQSKGVKKIFQYSTKRQRVLKRSSPKMIVLKSLELNSGVAEKLQSKIADLDSRMNAISKTLTSTRVVKETKTKCSVQPPSKKARCSSRIPTPKKRTKPNEVVVKNSDRVSDSRSSRSAKPSKIPVLLKRRNGRVCDSNMSNAVGDMRPSSVDREEAFDSTSTFQSLLGAQLGARLQKQMANKLSASSKVELSNKLMNDAFMDSLTQMVSTHLIAQCTNELPINNLIHCWSPGKTRSETDVLSFRKLRNTHEKDENVFVCDNDINEVRSSLIGRKWDGKLAVRQSSISVYIEKSHIASLANLFLPNRPSGPTLSKSCSQVTKVEWDTQRKQEFDILKEDGDAIQNTDVKSTDEIMLPPQKLAVLDSVISFKHHVPAPQRQVLPVSTRSSKPRRQVVPDSARSLKQLVPSTLNQAVPDSGRSSKRGCLNIQPICPEGYEIITRNVDGQLFKYRVKIKPVNEIGPEIRATRTSRLKQEKVTGKVMNALQRSKKETPSKWRAENKNAISEKIFDKTSGRKSGKKLKYVSRCLKDKPKKVFAPTSASFKGENFSAARKSCSKPVPNEQHETENLSRKVVRQSTHQFSRGAARKGGKSDPMSKIAYLHRANSKFTHSGIDFSQMKENDGKYNSNRNEPKRNQSENVNANNGFNFSPKGTRSDFPTNYIHAEHTQSEIHGKISRSEEFQLKLENSSKNVTKNINNAACFNRLKKPVREKDKRLTRILGSNSKYTAQGVKKSVLRAAHSKMRSEEACNLQFSMQSEGIKNNDYPRCHNQINNHVDSEQQPGQLTSYKKETDIKTVGMLSEKIKLIQKDHLKPDMIFLTDTNGGTTLAHNETLGSAPILNNDTLLATTHNVPDDISRVHRHDGTLMADKREQRPMAIEHAVSEPICYVEGPEELRRDFKDYINWRIQTDGDYKLMPRFLKLFEAYRKSDFYSRGSKERVQIEFAGDANAALFMDLEDYYKFRVAEYENERGPNTVPREMNTFRLFVCSIREYFYDDQDKSIKEKISSFENYLCKSRKIIPKSKVKKLKTFQDDVTKPGKIKSMIEKLRRVGTKKNGSPNDSNKMAQKNVDDMKSEIGSSSGKPNAFKCESKIMRSPEVPKSQLELVRSPEVPKPQLELERSPDVPKPQLESVRSPGVPKPQLELAPFPKVPKLQLGLVSSPEVPKPQLELVRSHEVPKPQLESVRSPEVPKPQLDLAPSPEVPKLQLELARSPEVPKLQLELVRSPAVPKPQLELVSYPEVPKPQLESVQSPEVPKLQLELVRSPEVPKLQLDLFQCGATGDANPSEDIALSKAESSASATGNRSPNSLVRAETLDQKQPNTEKLYMNLEHPFPKKPRLARDKRKSFTQVFEKKVENPFETKPRLARKPSMHKADASPGSKPLGSGTGGPTGGPNGIKQSGSSTSVHSFSNKTSTSFDYSPHGGVTFKENPNLNLQMVGTGYGEDSHPAEPKPSQHASKARDRRRVSKGSSFPSGLSTSASTLSFDQADEQDESPAIVGKGMFDGSGGAGGTQSLGTVRQTGLGGVYGVRVRHNSESEPDAEEDDQIAISQATRAAMQLKVKARKEEAERVREEREAERKRQQQERERLRQQQERDRVRIQQEAEERQRSAVEEEQTRQKDRLRRLSNPAPDSPIDNIAGLAVSGSNSQNVIKPKPPPSKANGTPGPKRKAKPIAEPEKSSHEPEAQEDLKPFKEPGRALDEALKMLAATEWEVKCQGLNNIRRLALHHSETLVSQLHTLDLAVVEEVKNLRSQVSRLAIICIGELLATYKKPIEPDLDVITKVLLHKAGEANEFIRQDVERALNNMVDNVNPGRAMLAIINGGADHRNPAVRLTTAHFLVPLVFKMGPGRLLSGIKDVTDRILPTTANFLLDGKSETRYCAMKIFHFLMSHEDFERSLKKYLSPTLLRNIQDKLDNLRKKGLSEPPPEGGSARNRRSGQARNGSSSRYNSAHSSGTDSTPSSSKRRSGAAVRTDEATMDEIKEYCARMAATDWKERQQGICDMRAMALRQPEVAGANITKIFDKFVPCLKDSNSKVNLYALQVFVELCPLLRDHMSNVITFTIQTLAANLSSKTRDIYETAAEALDAVMEHLDFSVVLQPFCQQALSANARVKPDMIERLSYIAVELYDSKPKSVNIHVLPVLWSLLEKAAPGRAGAEMGTIRYSTIHMVQSLYAKLGDDLLSAARNTSSVTPRMYSIMEDMLQINLQ